MANTSYLDMIRDAGVTGAGGAGFPTHVKLKSEPEYVIANCAECEPLIKSDKHLMELHAQDIVKGLEIAMEVTDAKKGVLAVKEKNHAAVAALYSAIRDKKNISVHLLENYYPAGDEQQIIYEVTGRVVPVGQIPIKVGCVVCNAQTLYQIKLAAEGKPFIKRNITVTGAVNYPVTMTVPIGTAIPYLIDLAGGASIDDYVVIIGGPLMGRVSGDPSKEFVTKTTNGVIVLPKNNTLVTLKTGDMDRQLKIARAVCCQCNYCTLVCSRANLGLNVKPNKIMQAITLKNADVLLGGEAALGCCNCGLCTYVGCNMGLTPSAFTFMVRSQLLAKKIKAVSEPGRVNPFREDSKVPSHRIIDRMGLAKYDTDVPYVKTIDEPRAVRIMLKQHTGAPCKAIVTEGMYVKRGSTIGMVPEGALGAPVHASIDGTVMTVTTDYVDIMKA